MNDRLIYSINSNIHLNEKLIEISDISLSILKVIRIILFDKNTSTPRKKPIFFHQHVKMDLTIFRMSDA